MGVLKISPQLKVTCYNRNTNSIGLHVLEIGPGCAGMLLNLQSRYRSGTPRSPEGADLVEALHVAGLGSHTACFSAVAVRELQGAEFPVDALWTDRIAELDVLADALRVRMAETLSGLRGINYASSVLAPQHSPHGSVVTLIFSLPAYGLTVVGCLWCMGCIVA